MTLDPSDSNLNAECPYHVSLPIFFHLPKQIAPEFIPYCNIWMKISIFIHPRCHHFTKKSGFPANSARRPANAPLIARSYYQSQRAIRTNLPAESPLYKSCLSQPERTYANGQQSVSQLRDNFKRNKLYKDKSSIAGGIY